MPDALGLTLPRLNAMATAYRRRRVGELRDLASGVALAMHDPAGIQKHLRAPAGKQEDDGQWVTETWWKRREGE